MADLTTLAVVKGYAEKPGGVEVGDITFDEILGRLITAVSSQFERETGRVIARAAVVETRNGNGRFCLLLGQYPVASVTSLTIDGVAVPARVAKGDGGYVLDGSVLRRDGGVFTEGLANVVVTYQAGYQPVPGDVEQAVVKMVLLQFRDRRTIGVQSQSVAGEGISYSDAAALANWNKVVGLYRAPGM